MPSRKRIYDLEMRQAEALARVASIAAANVAFVDADRLVVLPKACPEIPGEQGSGHEDDPRAAASIDVLRFLVADYEAREGVTDMPDNLEWRPSESADDTHLDEEVDLDALDNPRGASWAYVAREVDEWEWAVLDRWLWDDAKVLASGLALDREAAKDAVAEWVWQALDTESSASRQHFIDTGRYLRRGEADEV